MTIQALATASASSETEAPISLRVSGKDLARKLLEMREAARAAGLTKVALCLDYAYYEALDCDLPEAAEMPESF
jgi:hypothetical protein